MALPTSQQPSRSERIDSYAAYRALPDDGNRHEVFEGELIVTPSPTWRHQVVSGEVFGIVRRHVAQQRLGLVSFAPLDVVLTENTFLQPDIVYVRSDQVATHLKHIEGPPELCVEILSGSTMEDDRGRKKDLYEKAGVPHYWIVDPYSESVDEFVLREGRYHEQQHLHGATTFTPTLFPDLDINLEEIWREARRVG